AAGSLVWPDASPAIKIKKTTRTFMIAQCTSGRSSEAGGWRRFVIRDAGSLIGDPGCGIHRSGMSDSNQYPQDPCGSSRTAVSVATALTLPTSSWICSVTVIGRKPLDGSGGGGTMLQLNGGLANMDPVVVWVFGVPVTLHVQS
ncbi:MAG TPA: hypothetical protein VGL62_00695, partial [Vicinamibacterales bacterium]